MTDEPIFKPRAPKKQSSSLPAMLGVGAVVAVALAGGTWLFMKAPPGATRAAAPAGAAAPADGDGFIEASDGQMRIYEAALAGLGMGEELNVAAAAKDIMAYRKKVGTSQVLVGFHRNKTHDRVRLARLNANRLAGGGPEGAAAMAAFEARHADAVKLNTRRWELEAKVAEERGLVTQTIMVAESPYTVSGTGIVYANPYEQQRLNADLGKLREAEAALKAFKANPTL